MYMYIHTFLDKVNWPEIHIKPSSLYPTVYSKDAPFNQTYSIKFYEEWHLLTILLEKKKWLCFMFIIVYNESDLFLNWSCFVHCRCSWSLLSVSWMRIRMSRMKMWIMNKTRWNNPLDVGLHPKSRKGMEHPMDLMLRNKQSHIVTCSAI